jgi:hypothetical protein
MRCEGQGMAITGVLLILAAFVAYRRFFVAPF